VFLQSLPTEAFFDHRNVVKVVAKVGRVQNPLSITRFAVQSFGRAEKKSWHIGFHKKQLRVAPLRRSQETRSEATKFRTAELVAPGFQHQCRYCHGSSVVMQKP